MEDKSVGPIDQMAELKNDPSYKALRRILVDIEPVEREGYELGWAYADGVAETLPLPYMVMLTLLLGTQCKYVARPFEKTAWAVHFRFKGVPMRLEHGKFGMRLATPTAVEMPLIDELVATLSRAFPLVDRLLQPLVETQIRRRNVTVPNFFQRLDARYWFFRQRAQSAYESAEKHAERVRKRFLEALQSGRAKHGITLDPSRPQREGFYYGSAAIDAYFSRLEHVLVLMLPFLDYGPLQVDLIDFIGLNWTEKMKKVFNLAKDTEAKKLYDDLLRVKERYRNPLSHGGFEKEGESLRVHIPLLGAVPTRLSRFADSIHYEFFPVTELSFQEACGVFDNGQILSAWPPYRLRLEMGESGARCSLQ